MIIISIIIPVYNEDKTIITLLESVQEETKNIKTASFEIIVIDDCSEDETTKLLSENKTLYNLLVTLEQNQGKGGAVQRGLEKAKGDYILFQDGDLEYSPKDYEALIGPIINFGADVVIGSRFLAPQFIRVHYYWHKIGNLVLTLIFNILNNTTFTDIYSCYLIYKRELVSTEKIVTKGWEQHGEILSYAVKKGKIFYEVPIAYRGRSYDEGKKIRASNIIKILYTIIITSLFRK